MKKLALRLMSTLLIAMASSAHGAELPAGGSLQIGQTLYSDDGKYFMVQQTDGNLVVYRAADMVPLWASATNGVQTVMQHDGNLVQYNAANAPVWASNTGGHPANANFKLVMPLNGAAYVKDPNGKVLWHAPGDPNYPECPSGQKKQSYPICVKTGLTQYQSYVFACSYDEARQLAIPYPIGFCF